MVSRLASNFLKEGADIGSSMNFVTDVIRARLPVQALRVKPTFIKKVDEKGKIQRPIFGYRTQPKIFGKQILQGNS